jgi:RNA polymerase sigma factor for flagellar operon FliA
MPLLGGLWRSANKTIVVAVMKTKANSKRIMRGAPLRTDRTLAESTRTSRAHRGPPLCRTTGSAQEAAKFSRRDGLVLEHLRLVRMIAVSVHEKLPVYVDLDDMVQAGVIGLFEAANKFDADRQGVFSVYAKHRIKGAILDSLRQLDWASRDMRRRQKKVEAAKCDLTATLQRSPTEAELADKLGMDVDRWRAMMLDLENIGPVSFDTRANEFDDLPPLDFPGKPETQPDFICVRKELRSMLGEAIKTLPQRYQKVVMLYYSKQLTMKEIGAILGVNESRVSQVHKLALEKMAIALHHSKIDFIHQFQD